MRVSAITKKNGHKHFFFDENHIQMTKNVTKNGIDHEYQQFKTQNTNTNKLSEQSFDLNNGNYFF